MVTGQDDLSHPPQGVRAVSLIQLTYRHIVALVGLPAVIMVLAIGCRVLRSPMLFSLSAVQARVGLLGLAVPLASPPRVMK